MNIGLLCLVAFFWGTSNPLMKKVSADDPAKPTGSNSPIMHILSLFKRWKFVLAYLYDQAGSMLYYYALQTTDLSTAVPIANGLTFAVAGMTEAIVDQRLPSRQTIEGTVLILAGVYVCSKVS